MSAAPAYDDFLRFLGLAPGPDRRGAGRRRRDGTGVPAGGAVSSAGFGAGRLRAHGQAGPPPEPAAAGAPCGLGRAGRGGPR